MYAESLIIILRLLFKSSEGQIHQIPYQELSLLFSIFLREFKVC